VGECRSPALLVVDAELVTAGEVIPRVCLDLAVLALEHDVAVAVTGSPA
jgi:hypothetical protein